MIVDGLNYHTDFVESIHSYEQFLRRSMFDSWNKSFITCVLMEASRSRICLEGKLKKALTLDLASLI